ncbi:putative alpha-mannosidase30 [Deinococcus aerius]|uniref:Putative alpha-mannosidase30 n=1 Tax=Deinococcus aerius TaxID=200253 RepID=A0A2I9D0N1_9DEIO|nr:alpha-mannosidase [Deinococcus aerius]GBF08104.1 putative alpha-mannosidase30 [Deinococcus aerius]
MSHVTTAQLLTRLERRLHELGAWRDAARLDLGEGSFLAHGSGSPVPIRVGEPWPSRAFPVTLHFGARVPPEWAGQPVALRLDVGGEGLLSVNGRPVGGLNPYHREYPIAAQGGEPLTVEVQASPKGLFGSPVRQPVLGTALLVLPDGDVRALHEDLLAAHDAATHLLRGGKVAVADRLADLLDRTFREIPLPRADSAEYLARAVQQEAQAAQIASIWDEWEFGRPDVPPYPEEWRPRLRAAREMLTRGLADLREQYPAEGALALTGHAHIDLAWLWPLSETRRKARRTFSTVLSLMDRYPDCTFNQSTAQLYEFVREDDPELFARVQERVAEGRWDIVGGMWVEPDGNLISGESWARQLLYGQRYFERHFGRRARVCWLPDTFGYAANLPQFLRQGDLGYFFTTKLNWNETNTFPHDLYRWEGIDGTRVLSHSFLNPSPAHGYNGSVAALDVLQTWQNFRGKRTHGASLFSFGWGDGGGGPTAEMLDRYARLRDFPGLPRLHMTRVADFYDGVDPAPLPVWVGEQYLELHRGTYTTQGRVKGLNRRAEHTLGEAEAASVLATRLLGAAYPREVLTGAWQTLLRNQFHDILPGSSVKAVYDDAVRELSGALETARGIRDAALGALTDAVAGRDRVVVWNLTLEDVPLNVVLDADRPLTLQTQGGQPVRSEFHGGRLYVQGDVTVPGLGYLTLTVSNADAPAGEVENPGSDLVLDNGLLRVVVAPDGTLSSLYDLRAGREALADRGNQLWAYVDLPREWDAWEVDADYAGEGEELLAAEPPQRLPGELRQAVRVVRRHGESTIIQTYELRRGSPRLDIHTEVDWHGRRTFLRALMPLNVRSPHASFETAYGTVTRPTHTNTSWDAAQFEKPAHRWADLSEGRYGVSLLNDGKYGHSSLGNVLGLSLLRSPVWPDPIGDEGRHTFTYALYPHTGDWRNGTVREAHSLNAPLLAFHSGREGGSQPPTARLLAVTDSNLRLGALKLAEDTDGVVVRLYDAHGDRGTLDLANALGVAGWSRVNFLEEPDGEPAREYTPYRVVTLREQEARLP